MENPKLSILILTIPERAKKLQRLMNVLRPQIPHDGSVGVIVKEELPHAQGGPTIGTNRNAALEDASGDYVCFIDDDDIVPEYYIEKILAAIESKSAQFTHPDVIGFRGHYIVGQSKPELFVHSLEYKEWKTVDSVHQRCPNHLNPVKRHLAIQAGYPEINHGEDQEYSMKLLPLLKTEAMIDDCIMYFYLK